MKESPLNSRLKDVIWQGKNMRRNDMQQAPRRVEMFTNKGGAISVISSTTLTSEQDSKIPEK
jgi:hypothetical protein